MPHRGQSPEKLRGENQLSAVEGMRRTLLRAARRGEKVTYGTLMRTFGLSRGKALTRMIARVDHLEYASGAPGFAAIIVRKDTSYPGGGYFCDSTLPPGLRRSISRSNDPRLTAAEQNHIRQQQERIWSYYSRTARSSRR